MIDFDTVAQTAITPVVTLPVIAALTVVLVGTIIDSQRRLRAQATRLGKTTNKLLVGIIKAVEAEMDRRVQVAVDTTFNLLVGPLPYAPYHFENSSFSMEEIKDAVRRSKTGGSPFNKPNFGRPGEGPNGEKYSVKETGGDAAGLEGRPRPYHTATHGPRAG